MSDTKIIFNGIMLLVWFVIGVFNLLDRNISHTSYFFVWLLLLFELARNIVAG